MAKKTAKRSTVAPRSTARQSAPQQQQWSYAQPQAQTRPPFLKPEHIGQRAMLKFVPGSVRTTQAPWGHQLIVDVTMRGGSVFSWGIGVDKPNLRLIVEHLVSNPGKPIEVISMRGQRGSFIAVPQADRPVTVGNEDEDEIDGDDDIPF